MECYTGGRTGVGDLMARNNYEQLCKPYVFLVKKTRASLKKL